MFYLAASPVVLLILLLLVLKQPFSRTAPIVFVFTAILATTAWDLPLSFMMSATLKGLLLALDIMVIVFGAIYFVAFLKERGTLFSMQEELKTLSPDHRIQSILLAWLLGNFIEGVSGFGTAGAVVAPFLVGIGFRPLTSIVVALTANSTAVTFGAVGTPIRIGIGDLITAELPFLTSLINFLPGLLIPFFILFFVVKERPSDKWEAFKKGSPWALFAGLLFLVPYLFFSRFDFHYPTILGGMIGLSIAIIALASGYFSFSKVGPKANLKRFALTFSPYVVLLFLLILGKFVFSKYSMKLDLGNGLVHNIQSFNPGFAFITVILLLSFWGKKSMSDVITLGAETLGPLKKAFSSIFFISSMTYTMVVTGNMASAEGMLEVISTTLIGPLLPFYAAFIGAFGAFLAGSATVSNLLFSDIQASAAVRLGLNTSLILALQLTGAAAGNMIALPNILAVQASVGEENKENQALSILMIPCLTYLLVATVVAFIIAPFL